MPSPSHSDVALSNALKDLKRGWEETAAAWHDQARTDFEKEFIQEYEFSVKQAIHAITEINTILRKAISECS